MQKILKLVLLIGASVMLANSAIGATITYVTPTGATNSNATLSGTAYTSNYGIAFKTGASGPFDIDWVSLQLNTAASNVTSATLKVALHATNNDVAYSAVATSTAYATDTVSFSMPATTSTNFTVDLTAAMLPNLTAYSLASNTAYALIVYAPSASIGIQRTTGYANGTTNNFYTVTNGFTMLDTFRNNSANYTNTTNSYPTLGISFGANVQEPSAVPEPSMLGIASLFLGGSFVRGMRKRLCSNGQPLR